MLQSAGAHRWLLGEHFSVKGYLMQAWAGQKRFVSKDGIDDPGSGSFKGRKRLSEAHPSAIDLDAPS